jgi:SAM-dependent methyltransferase
MTEDELQAMLAADELHWWYRGRRRVLRAAIDRLPLVVGARLLDAGCGSGRMLDELARYGRVWGVDLSSEAVAAARSRGHEVVRAAIESMPFGDGAFDLVTCLDVIEHTCDERDALAELRRVTRPGGLLIATVPAYQALWSWHDEVNRHFRRYDCTALRAAARSTGWDVVGDTYFNSLLLAPAAAVRLAQRNRGSHARSDLALTPPALNRLLELPLRLESQVIAAGARLPAGLSLLAVLRRPALPRGFARMPLTGGRAGIDEDHRVRRSARQVAEDVAAHEVRQSPVATRPDNQQVDAAGQC